MIDLSDYFGSLTILKDEIVPQEVLPPPNLPVYLFQSSATELPNKKVGGLRDLKAYDSLYASVVPDAASFQSLEYVGLPLP